MCVVHKCYQKHVDSQYFKIFYRILKTNAATIYRFLICSRSNAFKIFTRYVAVYFLFVGLARQYIENSILVWILLHLTPKQHFKVEILL